MEKLEIVYRLKTKEEPNSLYVPHFSWVIKIQSYLIFLDP